MATYSFSHEIFNLFCISLVYLMQVVTGKKNFAMKATSILLDVFQYVVVVIFT